LAEPPIAIDADLFFGGDGLMPRGRCADIIHWSHSGYHVRDALGPRRDDPAAVAAAMDFAIEKMWAALDVSGLMLSVHQTRDISDGVPSQMLPVACEYCGSLDNVPELIEERVNRLGGAVATVNFASPLYFATTGAADWEALKQPARWHLLGPAALRNLLLLNFIAYDFSDRSKAGLEKLAENGTLASYIDAFRSIVEQNQGFILVKCGFQMTGKSKAVAGALDDIAGELRRDMPEFRRQMIRVMEGERGAMPDAAIDVPP
jgi:hypothetical protein